MTEQNKHPNHEWIVAFAEGKKLQWQYARNSALWFNFDKHCTFGPWDEDPEVKWRVKPETQWYRVALCKKKSGQTWTVTADNDSQEAHIPTAPGFVEWVTGRIEYTPGG